MVFPYLRRSIIWSSCLIFLVNILVQEIFEAPTVTCTLLRKDFWFVSVIHYCLSLSPVISQRTHLHLFCTFKNNFHIFVAFIWRLIHHHHIFQFLLRELRLLFYPNPFEILPVCTLFNIHLSNIPSNNHKWWAPKSSKLKIPKKQ